MVPARDFRDRLQAGAPQPGWYAVRLGPDPSAGPASIYAFFLSPAFDLDFDLAAGEAVVVGFDSSQRYTAVHCADDGLELRSRNGEAERERARRIGQPCLGVTLEKRPARLSVNGIELEADVDLGSIGCIFVGDGGCRLDLHNRSASL